MNKEFVRQLYKTHQDCPKWPPPKVVSGFFIDLLGTLFPSFKVDRYPSLPSFEHHYQRLMLDMDEKVLGHGEYCRQSSVKLSKEFFDRVPKIYKLITEDIEAMYHGDPAAKSREEVIRSYPGFYAMAAYRVAHEMRNLDIEVIPRMITEHAHSLTGIDIHPGAEIGHSFCIDHGTGIVIGETTKIGDHVKIYQGVTLGALSVSKEDASKKRHPTIEDRVVIYSGATILGGNTIIGHDSVIGGNVWITRSMKPYSKVYYKAQISDGNGDVNDMFVFKDQHL